MTKEDLKDLADKALWLMMVVAAKKNRRSDLAKLTLERNRRIEKGLKAKYGPKRYKASLPDEPYWPTQQEIDN